MTDIEKMLSYHAEYIRANEGGLVQTAAIFYSKMVEIKEKLESGTNVNKVYARAEIRENLLAIEDISRKLNRTDSIKAIKTRTQLINELLKKI